MKVLNFKFLLLIIMTLCCFNIIFATEVPDVTETLPNGRIKVSNTQMGGKCPFAPQPGKDISSIANTICSQKCQNYGGWQNETIDNNLSFDCDTTGYSDNTYSITTYCICKPTTSTKTAEPQTSTEKTEAEAPAPQPTQETTVSPASKEMAQEPQIAHEGRMLPPVQRVEPAAPQVAQESPEMIKPDVIQEAPKEMAKPAEQTQEKCDEKCKCEKVGNIWHGTWCSEPPHPLTEGGITFYPTKEECEKTTAICEQFTVAGTRYFGMYKASTKAETAKPTAVAQPITPTPMVVPAKPVAPTTPSKPAKVVLTAAQKNAINKQLIAAKNKLKTINSQIAKEKDAKKKAALGKQQQAQIKLIASLQAKLK